MADEFFNLLALVTLMFIGSLLAGYVPILTNMQERKLETVAITGAGFLLGTALIVIIPEGLTVLLEVAGILAAHSHTHEGDHSQEYGSSSLLRRRVLHEEVASDSSVHHHQHVGGHSHNHHAHTHGSETEMVSSHDPLVHSVFQRMGLIVCFGFIFMTVIEKISEEYGTPTHDHGSHDHHASEHQHSHHKHDHSGHHRRKTVGDSMENESLLSKSNSSLMISSVKLGPVSSSSSSVSSAGMNVNTVQTGVDKRLLSDHSSSPDGCEESESKRDSSQESVFSLMIGLLTHSAIDGVALGAVSAETSGGNTLSLLVFIALMTHKCPAAVSLTAFLKRKGTPRTRILQQLVIFSASAPVMALLTYFVLDSLIGTVFGIPLANSELLGWCLLFSGGTFLSVVTMHILPEIKHWSDNGQLSWFNIGLFAVGCILPSFVEHSHG